MPSKASPRARPCFDTRSRYRDRRRSAGHSSAEPVASTLRKTRHPGCALTAILNLRRPPRSSDPTQRPIAAPASVRPVEATSPTSPPTTRREPPSLDSTAVAGAVSATAFDRLRRAFSGLLVQRESSVAVSSDRLGLRTTVPQIGVSETHTVLGHSRLRHVLQGVVFQKAVCRPKMIKLEFFRP